MKIIDKLSESVRGELKFDIIDNRTNEIVDSFDDHNVVVFDSGKILIKRLYEDLSDYRVRVVKLGTDTGSGTEDNPETESRENVASDMDVLYTITEMSVDYSGDFETSYNIFINGQDVMEEYPEEDSVGFTSLGLFSQNDILFSFRRFPVRTITENFSVNIIWKIYYDFENFEE